MCFFHACESLFQPLERKGKLVVINPHAMQDGGIEFIEMHWITRDVVAKFISFTMGDPIFDATASQPHAKVSWVMIAAVILPR